MNTPALLLATLIAGLILAGCGKTEEDAPKKQRPPALITATAATSSNVEVVEQAVGEADSATAPKVAAEVAGRIVRLHVDAGDRVRTGQVLAEIEATDFAAEARRLKTQAETQQRLTERYRDLAAQKFISPAKLEEMEALNVAAQEQHVRAAKNLARTRVVAPIDGRVEARYVSQGDWTELGKPVFQLATSERLRIRLPFPETVANRIQPGQTVHLTSPSAPERPFTGTVTEVRPMVGSGSRSFDAIVEVGNPGDWKPGASVTGRVVIESRPGAVVVPEHSVVLRPAGKVVYIIADNTARQRVVRPGVKQDGMIEILEGVAAGEIVAVDGAGFLSDGAEVNVQAAKDKAQDAGNAAGATQ